MSIYALSDLHLSFSVDKPMNIFGERWDNYTERLFEGWQNTVGAEDIVIVPGDISWATYLDECYADFDFINKLNGKKLIVKGNHDYWWSTVNKLKKYTEENLFSTLSFIQNSSVMCGSYAICGTRGWTIKTPGCSELNEKIFEREKHRLVLALEDAKKHNPDEIIVAMHYPPVEEKNDNRDFIDIMKQYGVKTCVYGHLHSYSHNTAVTGDFDGIDLRLVSGDYIDFTPVLIRA